MNDTLKTVIKWIVGILIVIGLPLFGIAGCMNMTQSGKRTIKSIGSDWTGGLERTVTVYDYNGEVIKQWEGKFDLQENDQEIYFDDQNGKRVIIQGGITITEEK